MTKKRIYKKRAKKNNPEKVVEKVIKEVTDETIDEKAKEIFAPEVEKVEKKEVKPVKKVEKPEIADDSMLPQKSLFRIDEVARYFDVSDRTIRMWVQHGHLIKEKVQGVARISRQSILDCRFNKKVDGAA